MFQEWNLKFWNILSEIFQIQDSTFIFTLKFLHYIDLKRFTDSHHTSI